MKICFVIGTMSFSGAEKVLSSLTEEFASMGHEIHVILLKEKEGYYKQERNMFLYGVSTEGGRISRIVKRMNLIRETTNTIKPDLVVSFGFVCNINMALALLFHKIPIVLCERNDPLHDPEKMRDKIKRKLLYPFADGYVFQTKEIQSYFSDKIRNKSTIIPNPIINNMNKPKSNFEATKKIVTIARLDDYQKNQTMLIKAFKNISSEAPDFSLFLYGDGPDKEKYESLIKDLNMEGSIFLCGPTRDVFNVLRGADVFVLTSNFEGMPNALIEAMSVGMPCISTDCSGGGAKALVNNMENGILINRGAQSELEEALLLLIKNEHIRKKLGKEAQSIKYKLEISNIANEWINYFNDVVIKGMK